jgi:SAM-dependent methyltransferase
MASELWDDQYGGNEFASGTQPNQFIKDQATLIPPNSEVIEVGAGDGRNAVYLAELGHTLTAIDSSAAGLGKLKSLAAERAVSIRIIHQDILTWDTDQQWDAVVMTFLQPPSDDRPKLYEQLRRILRPGGFLISLFFRPEQVEGDYDSGAPSDPDRMVTTEELEENFTEGKILRCENAEVTLDEEEEYDGRAAVIEFIYQE